MNERKIQALNLAKEYNSMKKDMLTNATVIDDAIRFIIVDQNANQNPSNKNKSKEEKPT